MSPTPRSKSLHCHSRHREKTGAKRGREGREGSRPLSLTCLTASTHPLTPVFACLSSPVHPHLPVFSHTCAARWSSTHPLATCHQRLPPLPNLPTIPLLPNPHYFPTLPILTSVFRLPVWRHRLDDVGCRKRWICHIPRWRGGPRAADGGDNG
ncbi:hypothetical protein BDN70DRAFT_479981 [Pholiota conissans]|uniref:Uncharacterized protein n=1 Tax=Pholiota conissans TaxID=109636 RepID=A0A9P5Z8Q0_9AGAR|nr:hypothetical protein BDN70DRAFT_479981 [Pholiota conissans]